MKLRCKRGVLEHARGLPEETVHMLEGLSMKRTERDAAPVNSSELLRLPAVGDELGEV